MKKLLIIALLSAACFAQTTNTFPALQHFPGAPQNPCVATFLAQNDATTQFYTCNVNNLTWTLVGGAAGSGAATPGIGLPARFEYALGLGSGITCTYTANCTGLGSQANFSPTATETTGRLMTSSAVGSTNTVLGLGVDYGGNPGQGFDTLGTTVRFSMRLKTNISTTARYWVGMIDGSGGQFSGAAQNVTDTPNVPYCAFRFSTTTDTTWKAICGTTTVLQTVVDTGVAIDTANSMLFEIAFAPAGAPTAATFFINGTQVGVVSTNLPTAAYNLGHCYTVDNKNTATAESVVFYWSQLQLTK